MLASCRGHLFVCSKLIQSFCPRPGVLFYLGNRMFTFPPVEVDFYLPQLIVLYVYNTSIGEAIEPYLVSRSKASLFTSMHIVWLLDSFGQELPIGGRRTKSAGHRLRNQILEASDTTSKQHRTNGKSPLSAFHHHHQSNGHRNHCRSLSDATSVIKFGKQQQQQQHLQIASPASRSTSSATSAAAAVKFQLGEHAFDNGPSSPCDSAQPVPASPDVVPSVDGGTSCACLKAKIKSQFEFIRSLMSIGKFDLFLISKSQLWLCYCLPTRYSHAECQHKGAKISNVGERSGEIEFESARSCLATDQFHTAHGVENSTARGRAAQLQGQVALPGLHRND